VSGGVKLAKSTVRFFQKKPGVGPDARRRNTYKDDKERQKPQLVKPHVFRQWNPPVKIEPSATSEVASELLVLRFSFDVNRTKKALLSFASGNLESVIAFTFVIISELTVFQKHSLNPY
jgi:hypothetical protein